MLSYCTQLTDRECREDDCCLKKPSTVNQSVDHKWVSVKEQLPDNDTYVRVKMLLLFKTEKECLYLNKYFVHQGENITKWVTHWRKSWTL